MVSYMGFTIITVLKFSCVGRKLSTDFGNCVFCGEEPHKIGGKFGE